MRKEFSSWLLQKMAADSRVIFLTGDLGFQAFEEVQARFKERFINVGVAEQNMILLAAGLSSEGLSPICYSIAPFAVFRPYEQIRLNLGIHHLKAMIVGNGGGYGYGIMGATHHALEDVAVMSAVPNLKCFIPLSNEDLATTCEQSFQHSGPSYLRMGFGNIDAKKIPSQYSAVRKLQTGSTLTVLGLGPITLNALSALETIQKNCEVFCLSEAPLLLLPEDFLKSIRQTGKLLILEEHVVRGGIAEMVTYQLAKLGIPYQLFHRHAAGYPNKLYGSQAYHQKQSGLDIASLATMIREILNS